VEIPSTEFAAAGGLADSQISSNTVNGFAGETDPDDNVDNDDEGLQPGGSATTTTSNMITLEATLEPTDADTETAQGNMLDVLDDESGNMTVDFGFFAPISLGDTTFVDLDENGLQDTDEPELEGVTVTLFNSTTGMQVIIDAEGNAITGSTITDAMGFYEFTNLPPGDYYVVFDLSTVPGSDFIEFTNTTGGSETDDSDADPTTGQTDPTGDISSGERFPDLDAGVICITAAEAGTGQTICSTRNIDLTSLGASITPDNVAGFGATWTTSGNGTFDDGNVGAFGVATSYTLGSTEIDAGQVTLTLTTDDPMAAPFNSAMCGPVSDDVIIVILKVDCGAFLWDGSND
jgi:hypothetical protein